MRFLVNWRHDSVFIKYAGQNEIIGRIIESTRFTVAIVMRGVHTLSVF